MKDKHKVVSLLIFSFIFCGLLFGQNSADSTQTKPASEKTKNVLNVFRSENAQWVPFLYYMNETGIMVGSFAYQRNMFHSDAKVTNVILWAPMNETLVCNLSFDKMPIAPKRTISGYTRIIKFNDIYGHWIGNDSPDYERGEQWVQTGSGDSLLVPTNKGYDVYRGWKGEFGLHWEKKLSTTSYIGTGPLYQFLKTQTRHYKSDTWQFWWDEQRMDSEFDPHTGWRGIVTVAKSLNWLSHDGFNDWDYYKVTTDLRKYVPVTKQSTLAFRLRVESAGGKNVIDKQRTAALQHFIDPGTTKNVSTVAPFFDMALLGDSGVFKGFYYYRFYDNQSILLQGEYHFPIISKLQGNVYVETGRVLPYFSSSLLTKDYHSVIGCGVRYFFSPDVLARMDLGVSEEGAQVRIDLGQTF